MARNWRKRFEDACCLATSRRNQCYCTAREDAFLNLLENCGIRPGKVAEYFKVNPSTIIKGIALVKERTIHDGKLE